MKKILVLSALALSAVQGAFASVTIDTATNTITFDVPSGETETYDEAIDGKVTYYVVKRGKGRIVLTKSNVDFNSKGSTHIYEGVMEFRAKNPIGTYSSVYIHDGAQLFFNYESGNQRDYSPHPTNYKGIEGSGPDGTGAIRVSSAITSDWSSFSRNEVTLSGDAVIQCDAAVMFGFSSGTQLNLKGHKLTFNGVGRLWFGQNVTNQDGPVVTPGKGGSIVNNMTGDTTFANVAKFNGDETATFEINGSNRLTLNALANPFPWKLRNPVKKLSYNVTGTLGRQYNVLAGPIEYTGENGFEGTSGCSITFRGRIAFIGSDADGKCWRINGSGTQIYFESQAKDPSKYQISMSGNADCYYLTDTSMPRWDAEDGFFYFSGPAQYNTRNCELWLGSQGTTNYCTGLGVTRAIESFSTWSGYTTSRQLRLRTFGDYTANVDVTRAQDQDKFELAHTGYGTLDLAGQFLRSKPFHYRNIETNETVFSGPYDREAASLFVEKGTVRLAGGTMMVRNSMWIGKANDDENARLVIGAGGTMYHSASVVELAMKETGAKPALLKVEAGGVMTNKFISTYATAAERGAGVTFKSAVNQYGDITAVGGGYIGNWIGLGFWGIGSGTLRIVNGSVLLGMAGTRGVFQQDGGRIEFCDESTYLAHGGRNDMLMRGGSIRGSKTFYLAYTSDAASDKPGDFSSFTMMGDNPTVEGVEVSLNSRTNDYTTVLNLNAGRFAPRALGTTCTTGSNPNYFNFNGGTLAWKAENAQYIWQTAYNPTAITIYEKGGTIEINRPLNEAGEFGSDRVFLAGSASGYQLAADNVLTIRGVSGRGIKSIRIPDSMPRTGYVGIESVKIVGGDGEGLTAALDFDMATGTIAEELLVTCSGINYTEAPTVIAYGPDYTTEYVCTVELTEDNRVAGPLVKTGPGTLTLKASKYNTFVGPYVVSNGTLFANHEAVIPTNMCVRLAGGTFSWDWRSIVVGTLGGWGTVYGNVSTSAYTATVTNSFVCAAADLVEGRFLKMRDEGDGMCQNQKVDFGADCVVRVENPELLDDTKRYLVYRQYQRINRKPKLDPAVAERFHLLLGNRGTELRLVGVNKGFSIIMR